MKLKPFGRIPVATAFTVLATVAAGLSNPKSPTEFVLLSEVQVRDSTHWTVEFIYSGLALPPDSVTNRFYLVCQGISPSYRPTVTVNKNGYGLITPQQYPTVRLHPGDTVLMRRDEPDLTIDSFDTWNCPIDKRITPTQSMEAFEWARPDYVSGVPIPYIQWCIDAFPTLGYANDSPGIYGVMRGFVCRKDGNPIPNASIVRTDNSYSFFSDQNGYFCLSNILGYYTTSFIIANQSFGPFTSAPGCTTKVTCEVDSFANVGTFLGFACDKDSQPIPNTWVMFKLSSGSLGQGTIYTDSTGHFILSLLAPQTQISLEIFYTLTGPYDFGPFTVAAGCTTSVVCRFDNTAVRGASTRRPQRSSPAIFAITGQDHSNSVLVIFNAPAASGDYALSIFSVNGKRLYTSQIADHGAGTYSTVWNSGVHPGTYVAEVCSRSFSAEKRFIVK